MNIAMVFPGQGSQSLGMLSDLAKSHSLIRETFEQASDILALDLWNIAQSDETQLHQTHITQPILLTASVALWRTWQNCSERRPQFLAGHSLGEYAALVCANALSFEQALRTVQKRGEWMQNAAPDNIGAMAAILGLSPEAVEKVCDEARGQDVCSAVNYNSPLQTVIAGHQVAVLRAIEDAKNAGAKRCVLLPVSVPSHCALMKPAAKRMAQYLATVDIQSPDITVLHNIDCQPRQAPDDIRQALVEQLFSPVRWMQTMQALQESGVSACLEMGPGVVLTNLNKRGYKHWYSRSADAYPSLQMLADELEEMISHEQNES